MAASPSLPQNVPAAEQERRRQELARQAGRYPYDHVYLAPLPVIRGLPFAELFDAKYILRLLGHTARLLADLAVARVRTLFDHFDEVQDYEDLYPLLDKPASIAHHREDEEFARQRVAGVNPMVLRRIEALPVNFALDDATFQAVLGMGTSIAGAAAAGRLYLTDYAMLEGTPTGTYKGRPKYMIAPLALFCWVESGGQGKLTPVAIQLGQQGGVHPVFTPLDGQAWASARWHVAIADANHLEMSSHLGRTHLLTEPFILATRRQLASEHPLAVLLEPHFRFNLAINKAAKYLLINKGGFVDTLLAGTLAGTLGIAVKARDVTYHELAVPTELRQRGVDDPARLPYYPYRDDALLVWAALGEFVGEYLELYYMTDTDVANDYELQGWFTELGSTTGGRMRGLTRSGQLQTKAELGELITQVIFTCGPQHAAVNFPQFDFIGFAPNMPFAGYAAPPPDRSPIVESGIPKVLPPRPQAATQVLILSTLTAFRTTRLGDYSGALKNGARSGPVVQRFKTKLLQVEAEIDERNRHRTPYIYLKPSLIPNSTSI